MGHAPNTSTLVVDGANWLSLTFARDDKTAYPRRVCDIEGFGRALTDLETRDWIFRFEDRALLRSSIVDEISSYDRDRPIGEPDCDLTQVIKHHERRRRELPSAILERDRAETFGTARLLFCLVQGPNLQRGVRR